MSRLWHFLRPLPRTITSYTAQPTHRLTHSTTPPHALQGAHCLITGASRGIGRAIALALSKTGAHCTLIGRNEAALRSTLDSLAPHTSTLPHAHIAGDVRDRTFWTAVAKSTPRVDVLVNAAGITHASLFVRTAAAQIDDVVHTNLMGTLWACQIMGKKMLRNAPLSSAGTPVAEKGCIVNVASLLATHGGAGSAAYAASKAGVVGLTRALAAELGRSGVRVNAVLPGYVETDMTRAMMPEAREEALSKIPLARFGNVDEVADAVVFLATNAYANNCILNLDGGLSATVCAATLAVWRQADKRSDDRSW